MDRIFVEDLLVRTVIGVHDWERKDRQDVVLNLVLELDLAPAAASDKLADSVDYRALTKLLIEHAEQSRYRLIERLAGGLAACALEHFPRLAAITVRVEKPGALRFARNVAVEIRRAR